MNKNRGVLFEPIAEEDFVFGASKLVDNVTMDGDWAKYMPSGERQRIKLETMACVSFSANNCIESIFNYQIKQGMISVGGLAWLDEKGFMVNGEVNLSDRFLAVTSNTTKRGNTGKRVGQAIHEIGSVPESAHPYPDTWLWNEYYSLPDPFLFDIAAEFKERFLINYELVYEKNFKEALKHSPIQVYVHAWGVPVGGVYLQTDERINHAVTMEKPEWFIFDSYEKLDNYTKHLAEDFKFYNAGYKYKVTETMPTETALTTNVKVLKDEDSNTVGFFIPAESSDVFRSLAASFCIDVPLKDGSTDWDKVKIDGDYKLD